MPIRLNIDSVRPQMTGHQCIFFSLRVESKSTFLLITIGSFDDPAATLIQPLKVVVELVLRCIFSHVHPGIATITRLHSIVVGI